MTSRKTAMAKAPAKPASAIELPAELTAWRRAGAGRVISRDSAGRVTLFDFIDGRLFYAKFRDAAAAIAAVQTGAIDWTRKNRTADAGGFVSRAAA